MKISADVGWVVETRGVVVTGRRGNFQMCIPYPHAALWALLATGTFSPGWACEVMALLLSLSPTNAEREVTRTLTAWREAGLLEGE